jgi:CHASE2 domain-containing sensor protein
LQQQHTMATHNHKNFLFHRDVLLSSILTFVILFLLKLIIFNTKFLDPISQALGDFQFTDLYYSQFQSKRTDIDTNIVLINVGENNRAAIAEQLEVIQSFKPKVIGLDVTFIEQKDPTIDSLLKHALHGKIPVMMTENIVYNEQDNDAQFSIESSHPYFAKQNDEGYGNFLAEEGNTVRYYTPQLEKNGKQIPSLSVRITEIFDNEATRKLIVRNRKSEIINYRTNNFPKWDVDDVFGSADLNFIRGKIVLMGYMGSNLHQKAFDDNKLTPLNKSYGGHALPDMYGVEIHANIISMILSGSYIQEVPMWLTLLLAFIVCVLHTYIFVYLFIYQHKWFHFVAKIIQLVSMALIVFVCILIYGKFSLKLEPSYIVIGVVLSCDALYFYEGFAQMANNKFGFNSLFVSHHNS